MTRRRWSGHVTMRFPLDELQAFPDVVVERAPKRWIVFGLTVIATFALILAAIVDPRVGSLALAVIYAAAAVMLGLYARAGRIEWLRFDCRNRVLLFLRHRPSRDEFDAFLSTMEEARQELLRARRAESRVEPQNTAAAELERLFRLKERSALTQREYEILKEEIIDSPDPEYDAGPGGDEIAN